MTTRVRLVPTLTYTEAHRFMSGLLGRRHDTGALLRRFIGNSAAMEALRQAMPGILEQVEADRAAAVAKERALQQERRHNALVTLTRGTSVQALDNNEVDGLGVRILSRLIRGEYTTVGSVVDLLLVTSDERPKVEGIVSDDWLAIWRALLACGGIDETGKIVASLLPDPSPPVHG